MKTLVLYFNKKRLDTILLFLLSLILLTSRMTMTKIRMTSEKSPIPTPMYIPVSSVQTQILK